MNIDVTVEYANEGSVAFEPQQMAGVAFVPDPLLTSEMIVATFVDGDTLDVQYSTNITAASFTASDFVDSNQISSPTTIAQHAADTLRLTGWNTPIVQNDVLAYTGSLTGILSPQTINID